MTAGGIKSTAVLDELESHLREEIGQQMRSGSSEKQAFDAAVQQIGQAGALKVEFAKVRAANETHERIKSAMLTLAGIPNPSLVTDMNTSHPNSNIEPRWATYLKAAVFLLPAVVLWIFSMIFLFPKLQQICQDAGVVLPAIYDVTRFVGEHNVLICGALVLALVLLECRSERWSQYRRAFVGVGVFVLNAAVLVLITLMVVMALLAAPALLHHVK
ncbi:MAG: hypothetical protein HY300_10820 [Verrucomicrobia bacterium]|nr:hypothetical protein [Verrucomicrobiota bacterium]